MSEQPTPTHHMSARSPEGGLPAKNMADIARLFLDGARPVTATPQRLSPKDRAAIPPQPSTPTPSNGLATSRPPEPKSAFTLPSTLLGLTGQTGDAAWALLLTAASKLAEEHATTICLIGERNNAFVFELLGQESTEDAPRFSPNASGGGMPDLQIARALYTLRDSVGTWLIAAPDPRSENFPTLAAHAGHRLIACSTDGDNLISAYQHMKRAAALAPATHTSHAFIIAPTPAASTDTHARLQKAAHEFLHHNLPLAGTAPQAQGTAGGSRLATITMKPTDRAAIWAAIADELCPLESPEIAETETPRQPTDIESILDHVTSASAELHHHSTHASAASHAVFDQLSHVLDPEERAALSADLDPLEEDYAPIIEPPTTKPAPALQTPTPHPQKAQGSDPWAVPLSPCPLVPFHDAPKAQGSDPWAPLPVTPAAPLPTPSKPHPLTLRAFDLLHPTDNTRSAQWQAVESSIPDLLPRAILLDARPPLSWASDCCIALDPAGRLHVWTLYKDGVSWFALREWAAEHRNLLALTRRDLPVSPTTEVAVHIVLPLELDGPSPDIQTLLRTPNPSVLLYRLRPLQWNTRQGILVVPIA
jgi:hypothetical protein